MLFSGCAFFIAAIKADAFASPQVRASVARHSASEGRELIRLPSSLTLPISRGTFFEISGATSWKERTVTILPSTVGDQPTRGVALGGTPGPACPAGAGLRFGIAALPAAFILAQSIF